MDVNLSGEEVAELMGLLDDAIGDLSPEIADTDNPAYRAMLRAQRELLRSIRAKLDATDSGTAGAATADAAAAEASRSGEDLGGGTLA